MAVDVAMASGEEGPEALRADAQRLLDLVEQGEAELSVLLCDDAFIQGLNARWLGHDTPTDVLSFPQGDDQPPGAPRTLGDVVISLDTATAQADELGHPVDVELRVLLAHGLLHLLGHDHHDDAERQAMELEERRLLRGLGIDADGLVGRAT